VLLTVPGGVRGGALEIQPFDIRPKRPVDVAEHRIDAFTGILDRDVSQGSDDIAVITQAAEHDIRAGPAIDRIVASERRQDVVASSSNDGVVVVRSDQVLEVDHDLGGNLATIDANTLVGGNQAFSFIGAAAFSGVAGQLRYSTFGGNVLIDADVNGDSAADMQIFVAGTNFMTGTDFIV
jgi:hypothetical protein